jgi:hypothetical protein
MRRLWWRGALLGVVLLAGCGGPALIQPRGRLLKGGAPLPLKDSEHVTIFFVPVVAEGRPHPGENYAARYNRADGTFQATGKDGKGLPPGKYKVTVGHFRRKTDLLDGAFSAANTPFVHDLDARSGEIVLDLARPPDGR